jgi:phosphate:Na+ symporter
MLITAVIQSSSVTTVLVVGFISAGLLNLSQSIGVILGANVGTTITAQIIAFQVYRYGLLMIAAGFFSNLAARRESVRQWGNALMGLGLIFFGMELMSVGTDPLRQWPPFIDLMRNMSDPLLAVAVGAAFTAVVQSSSATTGIVIVLASQGLISLESGIGLIFGSNIGTCATAFLSAIGRPREALQAAWAHGLFNVAGVLLWLFFIPQFADIVREISPASETLAGAGSPTIDTARQIANAHTLFNLGNLFIFIWFTGPLARLVNRIVPERPVPVGIQPLYLDELFLEQPALALDQLRRELVRLGGLVRSMLTQSLHVVSMGTQAEVDALQSADNDVDRIYEACIRYLAQLSQSSLVGDQPRQLSQFVGVANYLENIGDVIEKDLLAVASKRIRKNMTMSPGTLDKLSAINHEVCEAFDKTIAALEHGDRGDALEAIESKASVTSLTREATAHLATRLVAAERGRLEAFEIETDIIEIFRRINTHTRRIARLCLEIGAEDSDVGAEPSKAA